MTSGTESMGERSKPMGHAVGLFVVGVVLMGLAPRIAQYLHYRALFHDEAVLAVKVLELSVRELFLPYGDSMAPGGFMLLLKLAVALGEVNEYAARFPAFAGGVLTLLLFYPVARRYVSTEGALASLVLLSLCAHLIYFGDYVRPYSTDATIAVVLLGLAMSLEHPGPGWPWTVLVACVGALSVWLSFPAVFVLAGVGCVQIGAALMRDRSMLTRLAVAYGLPAVSFAVLYAVSLSRIAGDDKTMYLMNDYYNYAGAFMPLPPTSLSDLEWFRFHIAKVFDFPLGLNYAGLGLFALLTGAYALGKRSPKRLLMLIAPLAMALLASGLHRYPFWQRTILYLAPILFLLVGEGIGFIARELRPHGRVVAALLLAVLIFVPGYRAARQVFRPTSHHELNRVLDYAQEHWLDGDLLYVHWFSSDAMPFLDWRYDFPEEDMLIEWTQFAVDDPDVAFFELNLPRMRAGGRVWVAGTSDALEYLDPYFGRFDGVARRVDERGALGARVVLFEFNEDL